MGASASSAVSSPRLMGRTARTQALPARTGCRRRDGAREAQCRQKSMKARSSDARDDYTSRKAARRGRALFYAVIKRHHQYTARLRYGDTRRELASARHFSISPCHAECLSHFLALMPCQQQQVQPSLHACRMVASARMPRAGADIDCRWRHDIYCCVRGA